MATEIKVPALGESVTEATVARWLKKAGEAVKQDEPLVELETDKVTLEVNASAAGVLTEIVQPEGATVEVGALLGTIDAAGSPAKPAPARAEAAKPAAAAPVAAAKAEVAASPAARKMIADQGLEAGTIAATGKGGRVTKEDVVNFVEAKPAAAPAAPAPSVAPAAAPAPRREAGPREERVRMSRLRRRIAERLKDAQNTAAILTTFNEVDMSRVIAVRERHRDAFEKKHGVKLGFMSFFV
ncbi:biotin/lipoyl-containing protein, partial [Stella sp.]|uniref:biotin/lipoyl-containing protein n=1 Tax=Stella sp. TaxID=2912054 RepID=UPI0035B3F2D1